MNAASEKVKNTRVDEPDKTPPDSSATGSIRTSELMDEASLHDDTDRRLYRRSVAYFFFGFGYNKNVILTDEP